VPWKPGKRAETETEISRLNRQNQWRNYKAMHIIVGFWERIRAARSTFWIVQHTEITIRNCGGVNHENFLIPNNSVEHCSILLKFGKLVHFGASEAPCNQVSHQRPQVWNFAFHRPFGEQNLLPHKSKMAHILKLITSQLAANCLISLKFGAQMHYGSYRRPCDQNRKRK